MDALQPRAEPADDVPARAHELRPPAVQPGVAVRPPVPVRGATRHCPHGHRAQLPGHLRGRAVLPVWHAFFPHHERPRRVRLGLLDAQLLLLSAGPDGGKHPDLHGVGAHDDDPVHPAAGGGRAGAELELHRPFVCHFGRICARIRIPETVHESAVPDRRTRRDGAGRRDQPPAAAGSLHPRAGRQQQPVRAALARGPGAGHQ
ncbi:hypothetical protein KL929_002272 [Ogataea haglerorum]|nr:hypothetical protein KL929_002272 [Ogataea haglerorum]